MCAFGGYAYWLHSRTRNDTFGKILTRLWLFTAHEHGAANSVKSNCVLFYDELKPGIEISAKSRLINITAKWGNKEKENNLNGKTIRFACWFINQKNHSIAHSMLIFEGGPIYSVRMYYIILHVANQFVFHAKIIFRNDRVSTTYVGISKEIARTE